MVATPRKRTNEATHTTPKNRTRQSSANRRRAKSRVDDSGSSGESAEQPSANEEILAEVSRTGTSEGGGAKTEMVSGVTEKVFNSASAILTPEPELKSEAENFNSEPWFPTDEELASWSVANNIEATIASILENCGFVSVNDGDEIFPDDEPESYRGWQLCTESPNGGLIAVDVMPPDGHWWSLYTRELFSHYDHEQAIAWTKQLIDRVIAAVDKASGQLSLLEESNSSQIAETRPALESQADETLTKSEPSHITKDVPLTKFDIGDEVVADYSRYDRTSPPPGLQQIKDGHSGRVSEVKTHGKHVEYLVCFDGVPGRIAVPEHFLRFAEDNRWVFEKGDRIREKFSGRTGTITGQASSASNYVRWDDGTGGVTSKGIAEAIQDELTIATDNNQLAIIETNPESITSGSTLDLLITETKTLYGKLEEAEQVAVSAAHSALEFAREMGDRLLQLKKLAGHGNWERVREQIKSPRTNRPIPSSTASLYQRIFERWSELDAEAVATIREASEALKKPRLNSATVADLQPIVHEKGLADSLEGLQADFQERKAAAESLEEKYRLVESETVPKFDDLIALYQPIGDIRPTRDGKGFAVLRPDLGNPFPLSFRNRETAWDYWLKNKDKILALAERKPKPDYESSSISGWQQDDVLTTEGGQVGKVLAIADNGKVAVEWENRHTGLYTPKEIEAYGYRKAEALVNTPAEFPNAVKTTDSVNQTVWGLSEVHYAVRKFAVLNDRQWDEQMCDEVAAAVLDFLAEY